jgi:hypothetical protein
MDYRRPKNKYVKNIQLSTYFLAHVLMNFAAHLYFLNIF